MTRSSATAEIQRVIFARVFLGWLTDPAIHWTPQLVFSSTS